ncbi:MAG: hypothetical protein R2880_04250 [Deinococcales bacterium]
MLLALILSSIVSGAIATGLMVLCLYLPLLWNGRYYDTLGAIGAVFTRRNDAQSRVIGAIILLIGGIIFALFYGFFVLMFEKGPLNIPNYGILPGWPVKVNMMYIFLGLAGGLGQGMFMAMITSFIVADFHPVEAYRDNVTLIMSYIIGHTIYGIVVMFFQSQFLQFLT